MKALYYLHSIMRSIFYGYHRLMRSIHRRKGSWQTQKFEYHHHKMKHYAGLLLVVLFLCNGTVTAGTQTDEEKSISAAQKLIKASVMIEPELFSTGSGFYISPDTIITNEHVINGSSKVKFSNKAGQSCTGTVGYREEKVDLALIHTTCTNENVLTLNGTSEEGQTVLAFGNPRGFPYTLTKGVVSSLRWDLIQFDAKVTFGSSGGVLANLSGEVIGVVARGAKDAEYVGFAIPANEVKKFIQRSR